MFGFPLGNPQILLESPKVLPWKWVWSSRSVLIQNNFFKLSISQHLESFIHYFLHELLSRLVRGHWQQNVHLNWCCSFFYILYHFLTVFHRQEIFRLVEKTELVLLCWWVQSWTNHFSFNHGRRTQFPKGTLNHSTGCANYDLSPFHHFIFHQLSSNMKLSLALERSSAKMPFKLSLLIKSMVLSAVSQIWATVKDASPKNLTHCLLYGTEAGM